MAILSPSHAGGLASSGGMTIFVTILVFQVIAILAVSLRIWAKQIRRRSFANHDYLVFASLLFDVGYTVIICFGIVKGDVGLHVDEIVKIFDKTAITTTLQINVASTFIWMAATTFAKISVLCFYLHFLTKRYTRIASCILGSMTVLYCIAYFMTNFLYCRPFAYSWDKTIQGKCTSMVVNEITSATINTVIDLLIIILPILEIWSIKTSTAKKRSMCFMFSFGLGICAVNITRIYYEAIADNEDITYALAKPGLCAAIEVDIGIISACIAPCGPLLRHIFTRLRAGAAKPQREHATGRLYGKSIGATSIISNYNESKASRALHWLDNDNVVLHGVTHNEPLRGAVSFGIGAQMPINSINGDTIMVEANDEINEIVECHKEDV